MNRSLVILLGVLLLGAAIFAGSYYTSQRACTMCVSKPADKLAWLQDEFHLSDTEMKRIRTLHEGYEPECMAMCDRVAGKKRELEAALGNGTNLTDAAKQKLVELGELRAQCQAQMLQHFMNVSQMMPPEQGRRYLAEMKRLTLGFHEEIEQSMSAPTGHEHGTN
jgi:hypothetical protein